jgi:serine phosphatase RsbU (regulator of sigma subunit)
MRWLEGRSRALVIVLGALLEFAFLFGVSRLNSPSRYLGIPGAGAALIGVLAAVLAGPLAGVAVALAGGIAFWVLITQFSTTVSPFTVAAAALLWTLAAAAAGIGAEAVRRRGRARELLLSQTLREALAATQGIERLMALAPGFLTSGDLAQTSAAICSAAIETFESGSCALLRADAGHVRVIHQEPPSDLVPVNFLIDPKASPALRQALLSDTPTFEPYEALEASYAQGLPRARQVGARPSLRVPIRFRESTDYLLVLTWDTPRASVEPSLVALAQRFADQAALALEWVELNQLHRLLEAGLLPGQRARSEGVEVVLRYLTGEPRLGLGGDFVDYHLTDGSGISFVIGDVSGHGPEAAALGATLRSAWHALTEAGVSLEKTLEAMNHVAFAERHREDIFCTALVGHIEKKTRLLRLACAGHPPPVLVAQKAELLEVATVVPLGFETAPPWQVQMVSLPQDWSLLLYTDGLFEGLVSPSSTERFGLDRLVQSLDRELPGPLSGNTLDRLLRKVGEANGGPMPDDIALLLLFESDGKSGRKQQGDGESGAG